MKRYYVIGALMLLIVALTAVILHLNIPKPQLTSEPETEPEVEAMTPASTVPPIASVTAPASTAPATTVAPTTSTVPPSSSIYTSSSSVTASSVPATEITELLDSEERLYVDELIRSYPGLFSVYYKDLQSGESYLYEAYTLYYPASLVKVPYALYLLSLADEGQCDLDAVLTLQERQKQKGTGDLKNAPEGSQYTVRELIEYMITISDNTAFKMLRDQYSLWDYNKYCRKTLGISSVTYEKVTAEDMAICMEAVYRYIMTETPNALFLKDLMARAKFCNIKAPGSELIIHKHGWGNPTFNDMALVFGERDYLIVIMSDRCDGTKEDIKMFHKISSAIYEFQKSATPVPQSSVNTSSQSTASSAAVLQSKAEAAI